MKQQIEDIDWQKNSTTELRTTDFCSSEVKTPLAMCFSSLIPRHSPGWGWVGGERIRITRRALVSCCAPSPLQKHEMLHYLSILTAWTTCPAPCACRCTCVLEKARNAALFNVFFDSWNNSRLFSSTLDCLVTLNALHKFIKPGRNFNTPIVFTVSMAWLKPAAWLHSCTSDSQFSL